MWNKGVFEWDGMGWRWRWRSRVGVLYENIGENI
jgi:hypothetical protein